MRDASVAQGDQGGFQQIRGRRERWKGSKKVDIASRPSGQVEDKKIISSFLFSSFPNRFRARDMYDVFSVHGRVVEVVILARREGSRKRFGFVRFLNVREPERMATILDNILVEGKKLHVNLHRFKYDDHLGLR